MTRTEERVAVEIPPAGEARRSWIRYELSKRTNPETGKGWKPADIARKAHVAESTVSLVFTGERANGRGTEKVMRITARILELTTDALFGVALEAGDGYPGSAPEDPPAP